MWWCTAEEETLTSFSNISCIFVWPSTVFLLFCHTELKEQLLARSSRVDDIERLKTEFNEQKRGIKEQNEAELESLRRFVITCSLCAFILTEGFSLHWQMVAVETDWNSSSQTCSAQHAVYTFIRLSVYSFSFYSTQLLCLTLTVLQVLWAAVAGDRGEPQRGNCPAPA